MAPRYPLVDIQALARSDDLIFANRRAQRNALALDWTMETLAAFVCDLKSRHHKGVRSGLSVFDGRDTVDVDKYLARFDEDLLRVTTDRRCCEFFVELAIKATHGGRTVLVVSLHLDSQP